MAELLECLLCGYKTVRCGMHNHMRAKHWEKSGYFDFKKSVKSLGQVKNWSQDRNQKPKET